MKKISEYDQEMPQSHTADYPRHREEESQNKLSQDTRNKIKESKQPALSSPSR